MEDDNDMLIIVVNMHNVLVVCVEYSSKSIEQYCNTQSDYG